MMYRTIIGPATSDWVTGSMVGVTMAAITNAPTIASRHQWISCFALTMRNRAKEHDDDRRLEGDPGPEEQSVVTKSM